MMTLDFRQTQFLTSAETLAQCPEDIGIEVAFAGRSNAGKSSAINCLTDNKRMARTSKTPGRTQLINLFSIDEQRRLVDLPGYGYAKVAEQVKLKWQKHLNDYLQKRESLHGLVLLMDIRHPLQSDDVMVIEWAIASQLPLHILLTKADKLKPNACRQAVFNITKEIANYSQDITVQPFSSLKKTGLIELQEQLNSWYQANEDA